MAIAATAFSFYRHGTMEKARKMFHASLLFLPVFMSGLLIHRVYDEDKQPVLEVAGLLNSATEEVKTQRRKKRAAQAPVAYASAAPFPFLPAPSFYSP